MLLLNRTSLIVIMSLALSCCGFQLRGTYDLATAMSPMLVNTSENELRLELRSLLRANDLKVANTAESHASKLTIDRVQRNRRVLSVDSRGRAREYELRYELSYKLDFDTGKGSSTLNNTISLTRELLFDPENVLAINSEIESLYVDMQRDAAQIIIRQLQTVK